MRWAGGTPWCRWRWDRRWASGRWPGGAPIRAPSGLPEAAASVAENSRGNRKRVGVTSPHLRARSCPYSVQPILEDNVAYHLEGRLLEVCNCRVLCPCWIGEDPDFGTCDTIVAWGLVKRQVNGVDVS